MAGSSNNKTMLIGGGIVVVAGALVYFFAFGDAADSDAPPARPPMAMDESSDEFDDSGSGTVERGTGSDEARTAESRLAGTDATPDDVTNDSDDQASKKKKRRTPKKRARKAAQDEEVEEQGSTQVQGKPSFKGVPRGGG